MVNSKYFLLAHSKKTLTYVNFSSKKAVWDFGIKHCPRAYTRTVICLQSVNLYINIRHNPIRSKLVAIPPMQMFCCQPTERQSLLQIPHHSKTSKWLHIYDQKEITYKLCNSSDIKGFRNELSFLVAATTI